MKQEEFKVGMFIWNDFLSKTMLVKEVNKTNITAYFYTDAGEKKEIRIFENEFDACSINDYSPNNFDIDSYIVKNVEYLKSYKYIILSFMALAAIYMIKNILSL